MGWAMNGYMTGVMNVASLNSSPEPGLDVILKILPSMAVLLVVGMLGYALIVAVVYALMRLYETRENRLKGLKWAELKPVFVQMLKRYVILMLAGLVLLVALGLVWALLYLALNAAFGSATAVVLLIFLTYLAVFVLLLPISIVTPVYLFEDDIAVVAAFKKALRLGFRTWAGIFGVLFVLGLLAGTISGIFSLPWMIAYLAKIFFMFDEGSVGFVGTAAFNGMFWLLSALQCYVNLVCYSVPFIGLAYQYGHAVEKLDKGKEDMGIIH